MTDKIFISPKKENLSLLAAPVIHQSLFGVAPREIMGETAFKKIKKEVQARAKNHCEICGRFVAHTWETKDWIHTHEVYRVDKENKRYYFEKFIGICKECHHFIHIGYLTVLLNNKSITREYYDFVINRGTKMLSLIGLTKEANTDFKSVYLMSYNDHLYVNDIDPAVAINLHLDGVRIIHYVGSPNKLPEKLYYKKPM